MNCTQCIMIGLSSLLIAILDGNAEFALLVNSNREKIADDTINKETNDSTANSIGTNNVP